MAPVVVAIASAIILMITAVYTLRRRKRVRRRAPEDEYRGAIRDIRRIGAKAARDHNRRRAREPLEVSTAT